MNQFIIFILNHLKDALFLALFAVIFCGGILFFLKKRFDAKHQGAKRFPMKKTFLVLLFIAYLVVLFYATILRTSYSRGLNLHLFSGWVEAWNHFSIKSWLNILLNIAMFIPLGGLLPLLSKKFEKPLLAFTTGFGTSLLIELIQLAIGKGIFDVDDLFTNTLGNFIGYSLVMFILTLKKQSKQPAKKLICTCMVPVATAAVIVGIFTAYHMKEYGNLPYAPTYHINTSNVEWISSTSLSKSPTEVLICKTSSLDQEACDAFGYAFMERIGCAEDLDVRYYDEETYFMDHSSPGYSLEVSLYDGSYRFHKMGIYDTETMETDEATIRELLSFYDISVPENATFAYEEDGWHSFTVECTNDSEKIGGSLRCQYTTENTLCEIQNNLLNYEPYKTETILSPMEAYEKLTSGEFSSRYFENNRPEKAEVVSCTLTYQSDTKGFYQPVYEFEVVLDGADADSLILQVSAM